MRPSTTILPHKQEACDVPRMEPLERKIRRLIHASGPVPFARFMEMALYDPEWGYYENPEHRIGPRGDYITSPELGPLFGKLMAIQIAEVWAKLGRPSRFKITEFGPGRGRLCRGLLGFLKQNESACFQSLSYLLVERSHSMRRGLRESLSDLNEAEVRLRVSDRVDSIPESPGPSVVLANEFLDALPVHWVVWRHGELRERFVDWRDGQFILREDQPSTPDLLTAIRWMDVPLREGQQMTVNLNALQWLESVSHPVGALVLFIIDYGYLAREMYSPARRSGTLACYFQHTVNFEPLRRVGRQDITAHVDFSALQRRARELRFDWHCFVPQSRFLVDLAARSSEDSLDWEDDLELRLNLKNLILHGSMGSTFKVLILGRSIKKNRLFSDI